jgi:NADH-quinone oxidoreductase subunit I
MELFNPHRGIEEKKQIGGKTVDVVIAPRGNKKSRKIFQGLRFVFGSIISLLKGMKITLRYLIRPSTVVTQQYPENRETLKMFERFRGQLQLVKDDEDLMLCNGCGFCELACPNGSITIKDRRNKISNKPELDQFVWRLDTCTFCNACLQACPYDALKWSNEFETSVFDRRLLVYGLNDYAGPTSQLMKVALRKQENVEELKATIESRKKYEGKLPMAGKALPGISGLENKSESGE